MRTVKDQRIVKTQKTTKTHNLSTEFSTDEQQYVCKQEAHQETRSSNAINSNRDNIKKISTIQLQQQSQRSETK